MAFAPPWTYSPISGLPWAPAVRPIPAEPGAVRTAGSAPLLFENSTVSVEEWPRRSPPSLNGQQERCPSTTQIHSTAPNPVSVEVPKLLLEGQVRCFEASQAVESKYAVVYGFAGLGCRAGRRQ